ncbi:MAG: BamA/TamA family outer membrane protein [Kofleriaceae bacterium]
MLVSRELAFADPEATADAAPRSPTGYFQVGAAYSSDDGLIAMTEIGQPDLLHTGQGLTLSADLSKIRQHAVLRHDLPLGGGLALRTELFARERDYVAFRRSGVGGTVELSQRLGSATHIFVRYGAERVSLSGRSDPTGIERRVAEPMPRGDGASLLTTLGLGVRYDTRDRRWLTGSHLELVGEVTQPWRDSTGAFTRVRATAETARTFGRLTFRLHGHAGYVRSHDAMGVPLAERLFDEGNAEVRGYALGSLGNPLGDNYEAIGRAEVELAISRKADLAVALFADAGVRGNLDPMSGPVGATLSRSAGVSVILRGLRFDLALPLDRDRGPQLLFNAGFSF